MMFGHFSIVRLLDAWVKCRLTSMPNHSLHPALRLKCSVATSKDVVSFFHVCVSITIYPVILVTTFPLSSISLFSSMSSQTSNCISNFLVPIEWRLKKSVYSRFVSLLDDGHPCTDASSDGHSNESFDVCPTWVECLEIEKKIVQSERYWAQRPHRFRFFSHWRFKENIFETSNRNCSLKPM